MKVPLIYIIFTIVTFAELMSHLNGFIVRQITFLLDLFLQETVGLGLLGTNTAGLNIIFISHESEISCDEFPELSEFNYLILMSLRPLLVYYKNCIFSITKYL